MVRSVISSRLRVALLATLLLIPFVAAHHARALEHRDLSNIFSVPDTTGKSTETSATNTKTEDNTSTSATSTTNAKSTQSTQANAGGSKTSNTASQTSSSAAQTSSSDNQQTSDTSSSSSQAPTSAPPPSNTQSAPDVRTTSYTTKPDGGVSTVILTVPASDLASGTSSAATSSSTGDGSDSSGISTGGIVGLSVAGGVALLAVVAFAIFKISRKRYLDEYDDGEAIKWPELGTHGEATHALPTHRTGGAGFETSSEVNLTRPDSRAGSIAPSSSAVDLYGTHQDPYAVPPLPHLNPSVGGGLQPYRDDPSATYYDPYSGPVPQTLDGEAIPMTQIPGRARSPMPTQPAGMGMGMDGRRSPGPAAAFAPPMGAPPGIRSASPAPGMGMRTASPAPGMGYGAGQRPYA